MIKVLSKAIFEQSTIALKTSLETQSQLIMGKLYSVLLVIYTSLM